MVISAGLPVIISEPKGGGEGVEEAWKPNTHYSSSSQQPIGGNSLWKGIGQGQVISEVKHATVHSDCFRAGRNDEKMKKSWIILIFSDFVNWHVIFKSNNFDHFQANSTHFSPKTSQFSWAPDHSVCP